LFKEIVEKYYPTQRLLSHRAECEKILTPILSRDRIIRIFPERYFIHNVADLGVLYILLKNICGIPAHKTGWGHPPHGADISLAASIDRIMKIYHLYCGNKPRVVLEQLEMNELLNGISKICEEIEVSLAASKKFGMWFTVDAQKSEHLGYQTDTKYSFSTCTEGERTNILARSILNIADKTIISCILG
jgi:hypothetical protein